MGWAAWSPGFFENVGGRSSVGRALESHSRGQGFDSPRLHFATLAQLVEHVTRNDGVPGSNPGGGSASARMAYSGEAFCPMV
jgi:hypothetical protein